MNHWQTILAVDFDASACAVYRANFPAVEVVCAKVADVQLPYADVVLGGPPCQSFSTAGKGLGKAGGTNCWPEAIEAARIVQPRMFLYENVAGMLNRKHLPYAQQIHTELEACGYKVDAKVLDAVNFGVPQFRKRLFYWGIRADLYAAGVRHCWPKPTHAWPWPKAGMFGGDLLPAVTVGQALDLEGGGIHKPRPKMTTRRDHPITEPCPTVEARAALGGGSCLSYRVIGAGRNDVKPVEHRDITGEPATTISVTGKGGNSDMAVEHRHSPAMLAKHPPAEPAPTVQAKWHKGGAEGLVAVRRIRGSGVDRRDHPVDEPCPTIMQPTGGKSGLVAVMRDPKHPAQQPEAPAVTLTSGGSGHGPTENSLKLFIGDGDSEPCPTISDGGTMTGGAELIRHHEQLVRRLTPAECARLQSAPDDMAWPEGCTKTTKYRVIGNGVACRLAHRLAEAFRKVDPESQTVIDLFCGGGLASLGWHGRYWQYNNSSPSEAL